MFGTFGQIRRRPSLATWDTPAPELGLFGHWIMPENDGRRLNHRAPGPVRLRAVDAVTAEAARTTLVDAEATAARVKALKRPCVPSRRRCATLGGGVDCAMLPGVDSVRR
jgi:hypothetical protein